MTHTGTVLAAAIVLGATCAAVNLAAGRVPVVPSGQAPIVESFLRAGDPDAVRAVAMRDMQVATLGGKLRASLTARTTIDADGRFTFEVLRSEGSDLLLNRVLVAALEAEQQSREPGESGKAALSPGNYAFRVAGHADGGLVEVRLTPLRASRMLVSGRILVHDVTGDLVQVDGQLSQTPSWWTTRVEILRRYAQVGGARVPVEMSSRATVRVAGSATFSMAYRYVSINGRAVEPEP